MNSWEITPGFTSFEAVASRISDDVFGLSCAAFRWSLENPPFLLVFPWFLPIGNGPLASGVAD